MKKIDIVKNHLVIKRDAITGEFVSFYWYMNRQATGEAIKRTLEKMIKLENGYVYEYITDKTTREVCACRMNVDSMQNILMELRKTRVDTRKRLRAVKDDIKTLVNNVKCFESNYKKICDEVRL